MEFWGVEVKGGEPLMVKLGAGMILHLSQACLGEIKKGKGHESVCLFVNVDGKKLVLGTLSPEKLPQQLFDLVLDRDFELTHNWKNGSVFFYGYKADKSHDETGNEDEGKPSAQVKQEKLVAAEKANVVKDSAASKQKVKIVELNKDVTTEDDDEVSSDDNEVMSRDSSEDDDEDSDDVVDDDKDDDDSDEDDEEISNKVHLSKKRALESSSKTPVADKKAKLVTPKKTDGKKGSVHVATPHPSKKTPANKVNLQTPKSEGSHHCKSCNRSFKSENALDSHNKAKHVAGK